jgi:Class-II DAHP synthetase family
LQLLCSHAWHLVVQHRDPVKQIEAPCHPLQAYLELAKNVDQAVQFMNAAGLQSSSPIMAETEFYVSHEALLLDYEQALTRLDSTTGRWCGPHAAAQHASAIGMAPVAGVWAACHSSAAPAHAGAAGDLPCAPGRLVFAVELICVSAG